MPWARVMRGIWSNEKAVTPRSAIARIPAGYASGLSSPASATPGRIARELLGRRALDRQQQVGARLDAGGVEHQRAGVAVRVVGEARRVSGAGLDEHLVAVARPVRPRPPGRGRPAARPPAPRVEPRSASGASSQHDRAGAKCTAWVGPHAGEAVG